MNRIHGFTLVEALIALVLSSLVLILVSTTFLVQNRYQANQVLRAAAHDNVRSATDLISRELRSSMRGGIVVAGARTLTVRSPVAVGSVCERGSGFLADRDVHFDGGAARMATEEIAGVAAHDPADGAWEYQLWPWFIMDGGSSASAARCATATAADTTDASEDFHTLRLLALALGSDAPDVGELVMLFRETTFTIEPSDLEPPMLALFRQPYLEDPVEFASGIDSTARFGYRLSGESSYRDTIPEGDLDDIDAVQLQLDARRLSESAEEEDVTFGWSTNLLLRNAP
ncbi:MAG: prepilin-type N-terminal cleavage/methylation domain-containing protein [Gemmatimonadota bacterium]|nr:prepilin-type N-terminal cleavage/methylation domain-containing protein [Gemmatimonadota bacterium]